MAKVREVGKKKKNGYVKALHEDQHHERIMQKTIASGYAT